MKDHEIAKVVNGLRDIAIEFHGAEQLRARIASLIVPLLKERAQPAGEAVAMLAPNKRAVFWLIDAPEVETRPAHWQAHWIPLAAPPAAANQAGTWQPIETAPRGEWLLAWRDHAFRPLIVKWDDQYGAFENEWGDHVYEVRHWQPLPAPPCALSSGGEG